MVSGFWPSAILIVLSIFGPPLVLVNANCDHRDQFCLTRTTTDIRERDSRNDLYRNWDLRRYESDQKRALRLPAESRSVDRLRERSTERTLRSIRELPVVREERQREISRSSLSDRQRVERRIEQRSTTLQRETRRVRRENGIAQDERRNFRISQRDNREGTIRLGTENVRRLNRAPIRVTRVDQELRDSNSLNDNRFRLNDRRVAGQLRERTIRRESRASLPLGREEPQREVSNERRVREDSPRENDERVYRRLNRNKSDRGTRESPNTNSPRRLIDDERRTRYSDELRNALRNDRVEIMTRSNTERRSRLVSVESTERKVREESERRDSNERRRLERQRDISERRFDDESARREDSRRRLERTTLSENQRLDRIRRTSEDSRRESSRNERRNRRERLQDNNAQERRVQLEERHRTVSARSTERRTSNAQDSQEINNFQTDILRRTERLNFHHARKDLSRDTTDRIDSRIESERRLSTPEARSVERRETERQSEDRQVTRNTANLRRSLEIQAVATRSIQSRSRDHLLKPTFIGKRENLQRRESYEKEQRRENEQRRADEQRLENGRRREERVERARRSVDRRDTAETRNTRFEKNTDRREDTRYITTERINSRREISFIADNRRRETERESIRQDARREEERRALKLTRNDKRETRMNAKFGENAFRDILREEIQFRKVVSSKYNSNNAYDDSSKNQFICHIFQAVLIGTIALKLFFQREMNEKKTCSQWSGFGKLAAVTKHINLL